MKLIFEEGTKGRRLSLLDPCDVPKAELPEGAGRASAPELPEMSENEISRHYSALAKRSYGVNDGFYPLGSCTMKYNPKINEEAAALPGFTQVHPLAPESSVQGSLEVMFRLQESLAEITGMDAVTLQPAAGAQGEMTGLMLIKTWHRSRGDAERTKILVPDSAHGTNPASAAMCGYQVVTVPSGPDGCVDLEQLRAASGPDTAGLMLTNPNTVGLFDPNILEITRIVHEAGGLCYYDGANLNAIMGMARPGDMGFDVVHINLHKTFSTPHGGGGPGSGPVGCRDFLKEYLPGVQAVKTDAGYGFARGGESIGDVKMFYGNFLVEVRALAYILMLGHEGIREASQCAVLNANYMRVKLSAAYKMAFDTPCMHEFVMDLADLKHESGVAALDVAKAMLDYGMHPPTMYFPLIVHEALMIEPTETEDKETLDEAIADLLTIREKAAAAPEELHAAPVTTPIGRPDEVAAARKPKLRYRGEHA